MTLDEAPAPPSDTTAARGPASGQGDRPAPAAVTDGRLARDASRATSVDGGAQDGASLDARVERSTRRDARAAVAEGGARSADAAAVRDGARADASVRFDGAAPFGSDCDGQSSCELSCSRERGEPCVARCENSDSCDLACLGPASCYLECDDVQSCRPLCESAASCIIQCRDAAECQARCESGSSCEIQCENSDCSQIDCAPGAICALRCRDGSACGFLDCRNGERMCANNVRVCGPRCPED
jgi:hypothetical protein